MSVFFRILRALACLYGPIALCTILAATSLADPIGVQAGVCLFPDPRNEPEIYVEFPFSFHRNQLSFLTDDSLNGVMLGAVYAEVILYDTVRNAVDSAGTFFYTEADSQAVGDKNVRIFNQLSMMILPGVYTAKMTIVDAVSKREGSFTYERIEIEPLVTDHLTLSSLELAHRIRIVGDVEGENGSRFIKNEREVIPNPMGIFSENDTIMYIYAELYNISYADEMRDSIMLDYQVFDEKGSPYFDYGKIVTAKPGSSMVITNILDISDFAPGRYDLRLVAYDNTAKAADTAWKRIIIFPEAAAPVGFAVKTAAAHPYDSASVQTRVNLVKFLMNPQQLATLNTLNDSGKVRFIDQFFRDRDPDVKTAANEFLDDAFRRYIFANENFSSLPDINDGWRTDRGRVLMEYGQWDEREEAMTPSYGKPWEMWEYYSLQGGVIFIFQDVNGYGDYRLVHSTAKGEVYSSEWNEYLKAGDPTISK
jgi:GWxTD domain-containing protein